MFRVTKRRKALWLKVVAVIILVVVAIIAGGLFAVRNYYHDSLRAVSNSQVAVTVTIPSGATLRDISTLLKDKNLIRDIRIFEQYVRQQGVQDKLQAGTYSLRPNQDVPEIVTILTQGHILKALFTIKPGQRLDQIKSAMINDGFNEQQVEQAFDPSLYKDHVALVDKPASASLEGYLYPESFQKTASTTPQTIIRQSLDEMHKRLTPEVRAGFARHGLSAHQGVILASVIEREVSNPTDRAVVSQVFQRRLSEGKRLESDVTAFYGAIIAGQAPSVLFDSPYNTYNHDGLPVGPISNVSASSLQAVAQPSDTDWLFFVSGDDGNTYFSHTVSEHEALTREHCKKLCAN